MSPKVNPRGEMPFLDHLEELRWRIFKSIGALVLATVLGFVLVQYFEITTVLVKPISPYVDGRLHAFAPLTAFFFTLKLSLLIGVILAFPIIVNQVWLFLAPALEEHERKVILPSMFLGMILFCVGVILSYEIALPVSLEFLFGFQEDLFEQTIGANEYLSFVIRMLLAFGIVFELPVVVMILTALGLATPRFLRSKRRHAIVGITVLAAFLSPGDVVMVTVLMMVPLILLYEFSILLSVMIYRNREETILPSMDSPAGSMAVHSPDGDGAGD